MADWEDSKRRNQSDSPEELLPGTLPETQLPMTPEYPLSQGADLKEETPQFLTVRTVSPTIEDDRGTSGGGQTPTEEKNGRKETRGVTAEERVEEKRGVMAKDLEGGEGIQDQDEGGEEQAEISRPGQGTSQDSISPIIDIWIDKTIDRHLPPGLHHDQGRVRHTSHPGYPG